MTQAQPIIDITQLRYTYPGSSFTLEIERFIAHPGERLAITGPSGCGKTTLLRLATGLLRPLSGSVRVGGEELDTFNDAALRALRIKRFGSIPQELDLLDYLSTEDNIFLPFHINPALPLSPEFHKEGARLTEALGLAHKGTRYPHQLSQGERQRVAIARSLITRPEILVADEPTGNLDGQTARQVLDLIGQLIDQRQTTFLMVTHDLSLLDFFDRRVDLANPDASAA